jgi:hypothetical protein
MANNKEGKLPYKSFFNHQKQKDEKTLHNQENDEKNENNQGMPNFFDLFSGKTVHYSFDCPENLRKAFNWAKEQTKEDGCQILQRFMALYALRTYMQKHAYGNTLTQLLNTPLEVGRIEYIQYFGRARRINYDVFGKDEHARKENDDYYCALKNRFVHLKDLPNHFDNECFICGTMPEDCSNHKCYENAKVLRSKKVNDEWEDLD